MARTPRSTDWLLSLATPPLLLGIIGGKLAAEVLLSLGQSSEELFRGDRLPMLHVPSSSETSSASSPDAPESDR